MAQFENKKCHFIVDPFATAKLGQKNPGEGAGSPGHVLPVNGAESPETDGILPLVNTSAMAGKKKTEVIFRFS